MEQPRLLDRVRNAIRARHYSRRTEETYVHWIKRFIVFHNKTHPAANGGRARQCVPVRMPVVLTREEVRLVHEPCDVPVILSPTQWGEGSQNALQSIEIKDVALGARMIAVPSGKGAKDGASVIPSGRVCGGRGIPHAGT